MITSRASAGRGACVDLDLLCEAINLAGEPTARIMTARLREVFPEIIWTRDHAGRLSGAVHAGYRPQ
mgnify:CR=1 FL=1